MPGKQIRYFIVFLWKENGRLCHNRMFEKETGKDVEILSSCKGGDGYKGLKRSKIIKAFFNCFSGILFCNLIILIIR